MFQTFISGLVEYQFLRNALITSVAIGIVAGAIGCFIILRGMSLMGDAISHAVLPGVALSYIFGINFFIGAIIFGILASILITYISHHSIVKSDTAIGITFSAFLALGVILIGFANSSTDLFHILFGNVLAVQKSEMWLTIGIAVLVLFIIILFYRPLLLTSFDTNMAQAFGMNVKMYHYLLMFLLTLVSVTAMQSVGTILIVALLITPAATAFLYTKRLSQMLILSSTLGALSSVIGLWLGYSFNLAAGSSIVLTAAFFFVIGFLFSPMQRKKHGKGVYLAALALGVFFMGGIRYYVKAQPTNEEVTKLHVVATNSILADITKEVGQDKIDLYSIVPVGRDPHEYEVLPEDIRQATNADLVLYNGLNLETGGNAWFNKLMKNSNKIEGQDYFAVSEGVSPLYLQEGGNEGKEDPHAWLDLQNGMQYVRNITKHLSEKDPAHRTFYETNGEAYLEKLATLHETGKARFDQLPSEKKLIVTSEGSFKYFSKAYGVPSAYIWEINTEEEGTPDQIRQVVKKIKQSQVSALFLESSANPKPLTSVSTETNVPIYTTVFTDSVAEPGKEGDSYYAMMKWNLEKIYEGLSQ